jgi:hypothetical protein
LSYAGYADGDASAVRTLHTVGSTKLPYESIRRGVVLDAGSAVVCTAGGGISSCPTRLKPLEADVKSATMEMPPMIAAHHRGMGGYRLSCSAEVVVCQFRKRVDGHMFRMRLLKVVQRPTGGLFCTPLQDAIEVHLIVG